MLFGDEHFSLKYQCDNCDCTSEGCCMPIYSNEFLRLIDSMATPEHPIDFGIEGYRSKRVREELRKEEVLKKYKEFNEDIMTMLRDNIPICYAKKLRGTPLYEKYCPTKNIRWQYADARQSDESEYNLEYLMHHLIVDLEPLFNINITKQLIIKYINELKYKFNFDNETFKFIIALKLLMLRYNKEEAIDFFFEIASPENSLVLKQFNKLTKSLKDLEFWKKTLSEYLIHVSKSFKYEYEDIDFINEVRNKFYLYLYKDDVDKIFELLKDKDYINALKKGFIMDLVETSIFLDIHYIFRTFKIPEKDRNPFLSILYAGDLHIRNITFFLSNIINYYEVIEHVKYKTNNSQEDHPELRCIHIPTNINFNELALEYGVNINKDNFNPSFKQNIKISSRRVSKKSKRTSKRKTSRRRGSKRRTSKRKTSRK